MGNGSAEAGPVGGVPEPVLLRVMGLLGLADLWAARRVCRRWARLCRDPALWRRLLLTDYQVHKDYSNSLGGGIELGSVWEDEYRRLRHLAPTQLTQTIRLHTDEVLHVSFAHSGRLFASTSKDCTVKVFYVPPVDEESGVARPAAFLMGADLGAMLKWHYTQCALFNGDDSLLLVSGVHMGHETSGEIAIFEVDLQSPSPALKFRARVLNKPYDIFGCWYDLGHVLNGELHWLGQMNSKSDVWLCKASQDTHTERTAVLAPLFHFLNHNGGNLRMVSVVHRLSPRLRAAVLAHRDAYAEAKAQDAAVAKAAKTRQRLPFAKVFNPEYRDRLRVPSPAERLAAGDFEELSAEAEEAPEASAAHSRCDNCRRNHPEEADKPTNAFGQRVGGVCSCLCHGPVPDRLLVFSTGSATYTSHQIGLKLIPGQEVLRRMNAELLPPERMDAINDHLKGLRGEAVDEGARPAGEAGEAMEQGSQEGEGSSGGSDAEDEDDDDWAGVEAHFDRPDQVMEMNGHVVGLTLSADERFVLANVRPWVDHEPGAPMDPWDPPQIAENTELRLLDLRTLSIVPGSYKGHKGFTPNNACFFIFADGAGEWVGSGSEDGKGQLWSRRFHSHLATLQHDSVVNSVAFSPTDHEVLVSASDDHSLKVWRSRRQRRLLSESQAEALPLLTLSHPPADHKLHSWDLELGKGQ